MYLRVYFRQLSEAIRVYNKLDNKFIHEPWVIGDSKRLLNLQFAVTVKYFATELDPWNAPYSTRTMCNPNFFLLHFVFTTVFFLCRFSRTSEQESQVEPGKNYAEMAFKMMNKCKVAFTVSLLNFNVLEKTLCIRLFSLSASCRPVYQSCVFGRHLKCYDFMSSSWSKREAREIAGLLFFIHLIWHLGSEVQPVKFSFLFMLKFVLGVFEIFITKWSIRNI